MTDTPIAAATTPPASPLDRAKAFIGDLARPFAFYVVSAGTAAGIVIGALKCQNGTEAALVIGAAGLIVGGMYGFKEWGNKESGKQAADVAIAQTTTGTK
jgi:hypothetical protein